MEEYLKHRRLLLRGAANNQRTQQKDVLQKNQETNVSLKTYLVLKQSCQLFKTMPNFQNLFEKLKAVAYV